jgi:putative aldouronate transport system permease protein
MKRSASINFVRQRPYWLLLLPALVYFAVFCYGPMYGILIAFKDFRLAEGIDGSPWAGLDNFARLFAGKDFLQALRNTLVISGLRLIFGFIAPLALAVMLNEVRLAWYRKTLQTVTYLPQLFSWVVLSGIFLMVFATNGPVNQAVTGCGLARVEFLTNDAWFITVLIATGVWQAAGYGAVIYLAALAGISPDYYEAAAIDGAGRRQCIIHITLPALQPTMVVLFILSLGGILSAGFDQIFNFYNPMVYDVADIVDTYVMRRMISLDFGLATAAGLFKSVVGMGLVVGANALVRRLSGGEQGVW